MGHNRGGNWCDPWTLSQRDIYFDTAMNAGFAMASASNALAIVCVICACLLPCRKFNMKCLGVTSFVEAVLVLLSLISLSSDFCDVFSATIPAATAAFIAGCLFLALLHYDFGTDGADRRTSTVATPAVAARPAIETPVQATQDGSKKIIRTTVSGNGAKTVEETNY